MTVSHLSDVHLCNTLLEQCGQFHFTPAQAMDPDVRRSVINKAVYDIVPLTVIQKEKVLVMQVLIASMSSRVLNLFSSSSNVIMILLY